MVRERLRQAVPHVEGDDHAPASLSRGGAFADHAVLVDVVVARFDGVHGGPPEEALEGAHHRFAVDAGVPRADELVVDVLPAPAWQSGMTAMRGPRNEGSS